MTDTPALPDDGKTATDENINRRVVEEKTDGDDGSSVQNQPQTATPSTQRRCSSSRTKLDGAAKSKNVWTDIKMGETDVAGTLEEQAAFMKDLEIFYKQNVMDFKPPKFYGEPLNCLKLWRSVIKLGGYEVVTANKLWRQVGESFHPPKESNDRSIRIDSDHTICPVLTSVQLIFVGFEALLEYEKNKREIGELQLPSPPLHSGYQCRKGVKCCSVLACFCLSVVFPKSFTRSEKRELLEPQQNQSCK
ncbi:hypothetical protein NC652_015133 [Populus alba x Populus x berolinensis]|nr:hypothetical protein NC652_015133 [Populus alba x Populus x berolinensis]